MDPLFYALLALTAVCFLIIGALIRPFVVVYKEKHWPSQLFNQYRGGVYIREPNGSESIIQNQVEQMFSERGMRLFRLHRAPVEDLLRDGIWTHALAGINPIDIAIIGRIINTPGTWQERIIPDFNHSSLAPAQYKTIQGHYYTLDVRFYGPGGQVIGAFNERARDTDYVEAYNRLCLNLMYEMNKALRAKKVPVDPSPSIVTS